MRQSSCQVQSCSCISSDSLSALLSHSYLHMQIFIVCHYPNIQLKSNIFYAIRCMYKVFLINLPNNISFKFQIDDNVGAVLETNEIDSSFSGQTGDL